MSDEPTRSCRGCAVVFARWDDYANPGSAVTHCHDCYLAKCRQRQNAANARKPKRPRRGLSEISRDKFLQRIRRDLLALTDPTCGICGGVIDPTDPHGVHGAAQLDHIIPTRAGGSEFGMHNLQLAHAKCNQRAGDKGYRIWRQHPMPRVDVMALAF